MDSRKKYSSNNSDKDLIAEQPGMTVLVFGFVLAFLMGYTAKSSLSPARVAARIEKAASHIHKDVQVSFESAQFSLSDGILPRMAVVISKVRMESFDSCWGAPILEVDELRLPVSLWSALSGHGAIRDIQANIVNVRLRENIKNCDQKSEEAVAVSKTPAPLVSLSPSEQSTKYQNDIRGISIQRLQFASDKYPQYQPEFLNFAVKVKSFEPRVIEITAKSHLMKDATVGDYLSHANINVQYKESPEKVVSVHFFGNWREGHYSLIANYTVDENLLAVETDLKHIPLSQILAILQKYNLASKELNGRQVWISSKARTVSPMDKLRTAPLEIRDLRLEGDLGDMRVDTIDVSSLEPLVYKPIVVNIQKLDVEKLLVLLNRPKQTNMVAGLGVFSGRAEIQSEKNMLITGEHSGLELVFSNKGQRELQVIDKMSGVVELKKDEWKFGIQRIDLRGGGFTGNVTFVADRDFKNVDFEVWGDDLTFATPVQNLMTGGGSISPIKLMADVRMKDGQLTFMKGFVRNEGMTVEGLQFGKLDTTFDWSQGNVLMHTKLKSLKVANQSPATGIFRQVTAASWWDADGLDLSNVTADLRSTSLKAFSWKNLQAQIGKTGKFSSEGSWNNQGELKGSVTNRDGKDLDRWSISGTREAPQLSKEDGSPRGVRR